MQRAFDINMDCKNAFRFEIGGFLMKRSKGILSGGIQAACEIRAFGVYVALNLLLDPLMQFLGIDTDAESNSYWAVAAGNKKLVLLTGQGADNRRGVRC